MNKNILKLKLILLLIVGFFFFPLIVSAAEIYFESGNSEYHTGDVFIVKIKIDTEGECINTIEGFLRFTKDSFEAIDFSSGESIIGLWLEQPEINQEKGLVHFVGGIPGGYCGRLPGDPGETNIIGKVILKVKDSSGKTGKITFGDDSRVLLNDGLGTPIEFSQKEVNFVILPGQTSSPKTEWQTELENDKIGPESFEVEIREDPSMFDGKYFIVFSTADKQTGVDHYEVKEGNGDWKVVESPYLLENQSLGSIIKVKAVDEAGNAIIAEHPAQKKPFPYWIVVLVILLIGLIGWLYKKQKNKWREKGLRQF